MTEQTTAEPNAPEEQEQELEPLLDLSTLEPERQLVKIKTKEHPDGVSYELRTFADFGIADQQFLSQAGREYQILWDQEKLTATKKARLKYLLDKMFDMVFDAPEAVKATLKDWQRAQVVLAFTVAPLATAMREAPNTSWLDEDEDEDDQSTSGS